MRVRPVLLVAALVAPAAGEEEIYPWDEENVPGPGWPGATAAESNSAWPTGEQPATLAAWPTTDDGAPTSCWSTTVLSDTEDGWPGTCKGLDLVSGVATEEACQSHCNEDPLCRVWQFDVASACHTGVGQRCDEPPDAGAVALYRAQQVQHGDVRVMKDMRGWEVKNLMPLGALSGPDGLVSPSEQCKRYCYSNVKCQYWQYSSTGCYVEDPAESSFASAYAAQYPLTTVGGAAGDSEVARSVSAAEYIQHICPAQPPIVLEGPEGGVPWFQIGAGVLILGVLLSAFLVYCDAFRCRCCSPKEKGRGLRDSEELRPLSAGSHASEALVPELPTRQGSGPAGMFQTPPQQLQGFQYTPVPARSQVSTPALSTASTPAGSFSVVAMQQAQQQAQLQSPLPSPLLSPPRTLSGSQPQAYSFSGAVSPPISAVGSIVSRPGLVSPPSSVRIQPQRPAM